MQHVDESRAYNACEATPQPRPSARSAARHARASHHALKEHNAGIASAVKLKERGAQSRAIDALKSLGVHDLGAETVKQLKKKNISARAPRRPVYRCLAKWTTSQTVYSIRGCGHHPECRRLPFPTFYRSYAWIDRPSTTRSHII